MRARYQTRQIIRMWKYPDSIFEMKPGDGICNKTSSIPGHANQQQLKGRNFLANTICCQHQLVDSLVERLHPAANCREAVELLLPGRVVYCEFVPERWMQNTKGS